MEEVKSSTEKKWVRKPVSSAPKSDWKAEYDKFCNGDCPRCTIFNAHRHDLRPCEIIWIQEYASVPVEKKEEYLVQIYKSERERDREVVSP